MRLFPILLVACAGSGVDSGDTAVDTDTDTTADTDTAHDTDTGIDLPCEGVLGVLALPGAGSGVVERDDPERWTGMGDYPSDLWAVEIDEVAQLTLHVEYPKPSLGTGTRYWMRVAWLDDECALHYGTASNGGSTETDRVDDWFTPTKAGWWFPLLYFPEAMPNPGAIAYDVDVAVAD